MDIEAVDHLLTTTRAVRKRLDLDRPVEPEVLLECLRLAVQAPTGSNAQGWRWLVVTDSEQRAALADLYRRAGEPYLEAAVEDIGSDDTMGRIVDSATYLVEHLAEVPVHVIPCIYGRVEDGGSAVAASIYGSIFPAVWSFQLALRSRGLGSCLTSFHLAFEEEAAELLGIPDGVTQAGLVPVAYYTGDEFRPAPRRPVEEITYRDTWKHAWADAGG